MIDAKSKDKTVFSHLPHEYLRHFSMHSHTVSSTGVLGNLHVEIRDQDLEPCRSVDDTVRNFLTRNNIAPAGMKRAKRRTKYAVSGVGYKWLPTKSTP